MSPRIALYICLFTAMALWPHRSFAAPTDSIRRIHADLPFLNPQEKLSADIYYKNIRANKAILYYSCYKMGTGGDSLLICRKQSKPTDLNGQLKQQQLLISPSEEHSYYLPVFYNILRKTGSVPPGSYKVFLDLKLGDSSVITRTFSYAIDSALAPTSPLRKELNSTLLPERKANILGISLAGEARTVNSLAANTTKTLDRAAGKIDRLFKSKGLTSITEKRGGKDYINLYYEDWFVGRYEVELTQSLSSQVKKQQDALTAPVASLATNELESYRSLLSQVKDLLKEKKDERELTGQIGLTGNWANRQPEYSTEENNYYELRGNIETSVQDMPIGIEGYYTTQDKNRLVKGSYIRVHYDAEKAKSELLGLIGGFKNQFSQTLSKGKGLEQIYGSYLDNLKGQETGMLNDLKKETGVSDINTSGLDTAGFKRQITASLTEKAKDTASWMHPAADTATDSAGRLRRTEAGARRTADSANRIYRKALKKYERLVELEQKAQKYYALVEQYRNTNYIDSAAGYAKLADMDNADGTTYKQLAKSAVGLLPEGKVKKFATGLTSLDAGIFPKEVSRYTMDGQQLKGIDGGYDLGFCQVGVTVGSTQFVGRDGSLDKYTAYSGRAIFKPAKKQKITLIYYGYTPSRKALKDNGTDTFFKNVDLAYPTFQKPVHIVSLTYSGSITRYASAEGEIATSFKQGSDESLKDKLNADNIAWHLNGEGSIPKTTIGLEAGYEHAGKDFQNSTLPVNLSGTDRLKVAAKGDFFKAFLTLGIEYNHIEQHAFAATGNNNRWGFEVATHSKRYPSVSLSYKPYTTFRSYTDTLAIPQRPVLGAVWTGRGSYQIKKKGGVSWRFSAVYNKSTAEIDTSSYGSDLVQLNAIYTTPKYSVTGSLGNMDQTAKGQDTVVPAHLKTTFWMMSGSYVLTKQTSIAGGYDIGFAPFGLSKYGLSASCMYRFAKTPVSVRATARASEYRLTEAEGWKNLYSGSLDVAWRFKMKLKNPK